MKLHSKTSCGCKEMPCGCCAGIEASTPLPISNRPGLQTLEYRAGTHATFLETMKARLSSLRLDEGLHPLRDLTTRAADDATIAMLDAWATVADVLTFYEERIANEGYLLTATERRSVLELARLIGYELRPGVAASVHLALTLENGHEVDIAPFEVRAQSVPGPGELPQTFENTEKLEARARWNVLRTRSSRPHRAQAILDAGSANRDANLFLNGISTGLNPNDPLLIVFDSKPELFRVIEVEPQASADRTRVAIHPWHEKLLDPEKRERLKRLIDGFEGTGGARAVLDALSVPLSIERDDRELANAIRANALPALESLASRGNLRADTRRALTRLSDELGEIAESLSRRESSSSDARAEARKAFERLAAGEAFDEFSEVVPGLTKRATVPPANALQFQRDPNQSFRLRSDLGLQAFGAFRPQLQASLSVALANATVTPAATMEVYALRVKAAPFGHNAPRRVLDIERATGKVIETGEWPIANEKPPHREQEDAIYLDVVYEKVLPGSWVAVDASAVSQGSEPRPQVTPAAPMLMTKVGDVQSRISRGEYGITGTVTRITLGNSWIKIEPNPDVEGDPAQKIIDEDFKVIRETSIFAQSERLDLAEEPVEEPVCDGEVEPIVLDGVYDGLESGRWVIVSGERDDVKDAAGATVPGVKASELAMLADVTHEFDPTLPGDTPHTRIRLVEKLEYCYRRDTVTLYANVVKATHGETRRETLGAGDGTVALQRFSLRQPPLTYVSAPTAKGAESTLRVFVNDVMWHEAESLFGLSASGRRFVARASDEGVTTLVFGNGVQGARLPTGVENVQAEYRQGIGKAANVKPGQITLLNSRPLGVKEVVNPLAAKGGADRESRDQARKNAPLAVIALDRLVSIQDYADFARAFAGIGKAFARRVSDGRREIVHVTIAGVEDVPIDETSDVFRNLSLAFRRFGEPGLPLQLAVRELMLLITSARVRILPDYRWDKVAPKIRAKLLDAFGFEKRELGEDAILSEVLRTIHSVEGVAWVDVDAFGGIAERNPDGTVRTPNEILLEAQKILNLKKPKQRVEVALPEGVPARPAQLAYMTSEAPDTLILNPIEKS